MRCPHQQVWEIQASKDPQQIEKYLESGWEPFSVVLSHEGAYGYFFKRCRPCKICEKFEEEELTRNLKELEQITHPLIPLAT